MSSARTRWAAPAEVNCPPTTRLVTPPVTCTVTTCTEPTSVAAAQFAAKVASTVPLVSNRASPRAATPFTVVKSPAMITLPSPGNATERTTLFAPAPGVKPASSVPLALSRAMKLRAVPLKVVNCPPSTILPSGCKASASTALLAPVPGVKLASSEPSVARRAIRLRLVPFALVKKPPTTTAPSGCTASARTLPLKPRNTWKFTLPPDAASPTAVSRTVPVSGPDATSGEPVWSYWKVVAFTTAVTATTPLKVATVMPETVTVSPTWRLCAPVVVMVLMPVVRSAVATVDCTAGME